MEKQDLEKLVLLWWLAMENKFEDMDSILNRVYNNNNSKLEIQKNACSTSIDSGLEKYIYKLKQETANPLVFSVKIGTKDTISTGYLKYLENKLREKFKLVGTPITVYVEKDNIIHGKAELEKKTVFRKKPKGSPYRAFKH